MIGPMFLSENNGGNFNFITQYSVDNDSPQMKCIILMLLGFVIN